MSVDRFIARKLQLKESASFTRVIVNIAVVAVGVSLGVVLLTSALIKGFKEEIESKVFGFWGHIHVTHIDSDRSVEAKTLKLDQQLIDSIQSLDKVSFRSADYIVTSQNRNKKTEVSNAGIKHIQRFITLPGILSAGDAFEGMLFKGVGEDYDWSRMNSWIVKGRSIEYDSLSENRSIHVSQVTADRLELDTGDHVIVHFIRDQAQLRRRFEVAGIYNTGLLEYDRKFALVDLQVLNRILGWEPNQIAGIEVFVDDLDDVELINDYLYVEMLPADVASETIRSRFPEIFEWLELQDINEWVLMVILFIIAVVNMVTVLIILILERTKMIGILKSLGSPNASIRGIFIWLAVKIVWRGLVFGNLLALGIGMLQEKYRFIRLNEADYYLDYAPVHFDWIKILAINFGFVALIFLVLLLPAALINRLDPVKSMKFT